MSEPVDPFTQLEIPGLERVEDSANIYCLPPYTSDQAYTWIYVSDLHEWNISAIEVTPSLRSQGIGTEILKAICAAADDQIVTLTLQAQVHKDHHAENARLQKWYERNNFVCVDTINRRMVRHPKGTE